MITDSKFENFIGIFDTDYDTSELIEYFEYQNKCGATFGRKGLFGEPTDWYLVNRLTGEWRISYESIDPLGVLDLPTFN